MAILVKLPPHKRMSSFEFAGTVNLGPGNWAGKCKLKLDSVNAQGGYTDFPENEMAVVLVAPADPNTQDWVVTLSKAPHLQTGWPVDDVVLGDLVYFDTSTPAREIPSATFKLPIQREVTGDPHA